MVESRLKVGGEPESCVPAVHSGEQEGPSSIIHNMVKCDTVQFRVNHITLYLLMHSAVLFSSQWVARMCLLCPQKQIAQPRHKKAFKIKFWDFFFFTNFLD